MRPLRLELEGFTAFRDRVDLDLASLDLFAITGPTGAGKSSLIDAISFALYGRVPRVTNEVKDCISQGLDRMQVSLVFAAGDDTFRVFREARRKGQPNVRLERADGDGWQAMAQGASEVGKRIERVVGLNYDAFTRSVLLPQGQFQEFLSGAPEKRRDVLQSLLQLDIYKRMTTRANEIAAGYKQRMDAINRELDEYLAHATEENLARHRDDLEAARAEATDIGCRLELWRAADELAITYVNAHLSYRSADAERHKLAEQVESAEKLARDGDASIEQLRGRVDELKARLEANSYDDEFAQTLAGAVTLAEALENATRQASDAAGARESAVAGVAKAQDAAAGAEKVLAEASERSAAAEHALHQAQRLDLAAAVQSGLKPGDACPVCGGAVTKLPEISAPALDAAQSEHELARGARSQAQQALALASNSAATAEAELRAAEAAVGQWQAALNEATSRLTEALPGIDDRSSASLKAVLALQNRAREERRSLLRDLDSASQAFAKAGESLEQARAGLAAGRQMLSAQEEKTARLRSESDDARARLVQAAADKALAPLSEALDARADPRTAIQSETKRLGERLTAVNTQVGSLENMVDRILDDMEKARDLRKELALIEADYNVAWDLGQMLSAGKFQTFIQAEALRVLAQEGSRRLQDLSGNRYRLDISADGKDFEAIDQWNADDKRSVRTLSGGETFLASLALALALAESLPGLAPDRRVALDAIFLDEGFGSLDPEALDRAAEALDSLRDGRRMVCVVTHLQELAQRMPARIVVHKAETGSTAAIA